MSRAMLALRDRGAVVFDYGNNIRPHAAAGGVADALTIDIFTARYIRPAVLPRGSARFAGSACPARTPTWT